MELAKDTQSKGEGAMPQRSRRKPLTIDLPAEEVARRTAAGDAAPSDAGEDKTSPDTESAAATAGEGAGPADDAGAASDPGAPAQMTAAAAESTGKNEAQAADAGSRSAPVDRRAKSAPHAADAPHAKSADGSTSFVPLLVAAIMGAAIVALVVVLLARSGYFVPPPANPEGPDVATEISTLNDDVAALKQAGANDGLAQLRDSVTSLKQSVAELSDREPVPAPDAAAVSDLKTRLATLSDDVAALKSASPVDTSAVASEVADLKQRVDLLSTRVDNASGDDRLAAIEAKLAALSQKIDAAAALAPAVAADALATALDSGRPFTTELAALKTLGIDQDAVQALAPHADSGLPTLAHLRGEFETAVAAIDLSTPIPDGTGVVDRLFKSARSLVAVRPAHPTAGADPAAIVTRIRAALEAGDLQTALKEWDGLPADVQTATAGWQRDAKARNDADDLVERLRTEALSRLAAGG